MRGDPNKYVARFWEFVAVGDAEECWPWLGPTDQDDYGIFTVRDPRKRSVRAHRHAYELANGSVSDGLTIDHLCRNETCANPAHMEVVTRSENNRRRRGFNLASHCHKGHALTPENTYVTRRGSQRCRACHRATQRRYLARQAA